MTTTSILDLSSAVYARAWEKGCQGRNIGNATEPITHPPEPGVEKLRRFFASDPHWIYLSGHFLNLRQPRLYSKDDATVVRFGEDAVQVKGKDYDERLEKKGGAFTLHKNCKVVLWGGCSVCAVEQTVRTLFSLFGAHLLLGYESVTGAQISQNMLGGGSGPGSLKKGHFFDNLGDDLESLPSVRDAWLNAAINGYGGGKDMGKKGDPVDEGLFRAVDPDGQSWFIRDKKIARGKKMI